MVDKQKILDIIDNHFTGTSLFLVDIKITTSNRISVFIDGDNGVTIDDCIKLSKAIEKNLDREIEDFELNVSSSGVDYPLMLKRQYVKNIGRKLNVKTLSEERVEGTLTKSEEDGIVIELTPSKKKKIEKENASNIKKILFDDIAEAKVVISF